MTDKYQPGPENADRRQDPKPIATKPMHARIIPLFPDFEISFSGMYAAGQILISRSINSA
jgi:hypothetical protein